MTKLFVKDICKSFNDGQVLDHFSLELESGEILVLMGPSGVGKTTLLRCMTNLESIDEGTIGIDEDYLYKDAQKNKSLALSETDRFSFSKLSSFS